jgi:hypothetical protein
MLLMRELQEILITFIITYNYRKNINLIIIILTSLLFVSGLFLFLYYQYYCHW